MRIYFVTDIHGSEVCFRKFLNSYAVYEPDVMIVGGDITGKVIVPILVDNPKKAIALTSHGEERLRGEEDIARFERQVADTGSYAWRFTEEEYQRAAADPAEVDRVFHEAVLARVDAWVRLAEERLGDKPVRVLMSGGNDDFWAVDDVLKSSTKVECPDMRLVDLGEDVTLLSCGAANQTPWQCPRDLPEEELAERLDGLAAQVNGGPVVYNLHVPPYDSRIDAGPALDESNRPRLGMTGMEQAPVGSRAVRALIDRAQPLLSLHGHVHESAGAVKLGRTLAINPGSEYNQGILRGALIDLEDGQVIRHQLTTG